MNKRVYFVTGYIPSDENKVYMYIWCLIKTKKGFYWVDAVGNSMLGGLTDNPGYETAEEALVKIHDFTNEDCNYVLICDFQEVLNVYNRIMTRLKDKIT